MLRERILRGCAFFLTLRNLPDPDPRASSQTSSAFARPVARLRFCLRPK